MCSAQSTYAPLVPSPLNPAIFPSNARNNVRVSEMMPSRTRPMPGAPVQAKRRPGPSEKLLRRKAAEAWKMEALHRQVVEYERQALGALMAKGKSDKDDKSAEHGKASPPPRRHPRRRRVTRSAARGRMETVTEEGQRGAEGHEEEGEEEEEEEEQSIPSEKVVKWHHFLRMPTLGFLAPKKLAKSLRFVRVLASWRMRRRHRTDRD